MPFTHRRVLLAGAGGGLALAGGLLAAGALGGAAMAAGAASADPNRLVRSGMDKFRRNDVEGSLEDFDAALAARPAVRPYLWQRGLSLYYLQRFEEGARQFRDDVAVNPNDTEVRC
jgi:tetratricopeptide (TPR) repeat protein